MKNNKEIDNNIKAIKEFLIKRYGEVAPEWYLQISLLKTNLEMKAAIDASIKEDGILVEDRFGHPQKNPLLKTSLELQVQIMRCIEQLGISPKAQGHLKTIDDNDTGQILANLLGE